MEIQVSNSFLELAQCWHWRKETSDYGVDQQNNASYFPPGISHNIFADHNMFTGLEQVNMQPVNRGIRLLI
jgi:hypothetical protein